MADPTVCGFLTQILCAHGGRMDLGELLCLIKLPEEQLVEVVCEAGPERFVLLDQGPGAARTVLATTPLRVCRRRVCQGPCEALHLCKLNLLDRCRYYNREGVYCKYSHEIRSERNVKILKKHDLSGLSKKELGVLLLQSDPFFLPDICKYYKGENKQSSCGGTTECMKLHICEYFTFGKCGFEQCNRSHNLLDPKALELLKETGMTLSVVKNIQDIYNEKHTRNKKYNYKIRGRLNRKNVGSRSQSQTRQELPLSPSASDGPAHIPELDKTNESTLSSLEGKMNENATKDNIYFIQDLIQRTSKAHKNTTTQEVSQVGTNLSFPMTDHWETQLYGSQDSSQQVDSISPTASADSTAIPALSAQGTRKVNVLFGSEDASYSGPGPIGQSGSVPSHNCTKERDDYGSKKVSSSPASNKTDDILGKGSSPVVFSKYKPTSSGKKEESLSKSKDSQSMSMNPQIAMALKLADKMEVPVTNPSVVNIDSRISQNKLMQLDSLGALESLKNTNTSKLLAWKIDAMNLNSETIARKDREELSSVSPSRKDLPMSTVHVQPKTSTTNDIQSGIQKGNLSQPSLPTAASNCKTVTFHSRGQTFHQVRGFSGIQGSSISTSGSSQSPSTSTTIKTRTVSPSKSTNAEDFRARVSSTTAPEMKDNGSCEICLDHLLSVCKLLDSCKNVHFHLPYRWQFYISNRWKDFDYMEEIEKAYCNPSNSQFTVRIITVTIDFEKMTASDCYPVRRLSTPSTIQKPNSLLSTEWHWYWKNEFDEWNEYGIEEDSNYNSENLEICSQLYPNGSVNFQAGHHKYELNFKEMIQRNTIYGTKREVRRRPKFVSSVVVYWNQQHKKQQSELNTDFPPYWDHQALPNTGHKLLEVSSTSIDYSRTSCLFKITMKNAEIQKIMRNQNPSLWRNFQWMKKILNGGNEKTLFHEADPSNLDSICSYNFDFNSQSLHGKGISFRRDASSSDSNQKFSVKNRIMFVSRVLVGTSLKENVAKMHSPEKHNLCLNICDSVVDNTTDPSTFVIFDKHQIYPEFVIEYTYSDKGCSIS